ncbi:MAG: hypothetical protein ACE5EQ_08775 [Phycisphaerae bacterium]
MAEGSDHPENLAGQWGCLPGPHRSRAELLRWLQTATEPEKLALLQALLSQFERNEREIQRLVQSIHDSHLAIMQAAHEAELASQSECHEAELDSTRRSGRSSWWGLGIAGLVGFWLGGGFSRRR